MCLWFLTKKSLEEETKERGHIYFSSSSSVCIENGL